MRPRAIINCKMHNTTQAQGKHKMGAGQDEGCVVHVTPVKGPWLILSVPNFPLAFRISSLTMEPT